MEQINLWEQHRQWAEHCRWVDLTFPLSPETPHWEGWFPLKETVASDLGNSLFQAHSYTTVGQYGTHVDAPSHMVKGGRNLDQVAIEEMVLPLCVIDKSAAVKRDPDYSLTKQDVLDWEQVHGPVPQGAFVAFCSGWSKRPAKEMDNLDSEGNRHFPGWSLDAVEYLVQKRKIGGIGHETSDTEAPVRSKVSNYEVEYYILAQDRIQLELLANLDQCPATGALVFCTFPAVVGGTGFPARCFALCPK